jgi:hypothetical protein
MSRLVVLTLELLYLAGSRHQQGNDWYDRDLFQPPSAASTELAIGGQRSNESSQFAELPSTFALLTAQVDEVTLTHARLSLGHLGWHNPASSQAVRTR